MRNKRAKQIRKAMVEQMGSKALPENLWRNLYRKAKKAWTAGKGKQPVVKPDLPRAGKRKSGVTVTKRGKRVHMVAAK